MYKEEVEMLLCKAIDNIPDFAEITDCYTEYRYGDWKAYLKVCIEIKDKTNKNQKVFHNIAHEAFNTEMGFIS